MKLFEGIKIFGVLLMVAMVISFFGCGEDEEELVKPVNPAKDPVTINPQEESTETPGPPARIVWIKIDEKGRREELEDFEDCDQIKHQDTFIVRVLDANGEPVSDVTRVEWTLNTWPDGVGDIIETDDPGHRDIPKVQAAPQIKVDNKFAITFTNSKDSEPQQLKGMGKDGKNIVIRKGETWITVTSTREGDTDVTAFAPVIPRDGKYPHKIFGVKHWIDLDWIFPKSKENSINYCEAGVNEHTFVTKLMKFSDPNEVVPGVKVRYSILNDRPDAIWKDDGSVKIISEKIVEATSDKNGEAKATIKLRTLEIGENTVRVEILPVALKRHGEVHEPGEISGECSISREITKKWAGPSLKITKEAPDSICLLSDVSYRITVMNVGDATATNIIVTDTFNPECFKFVSADNGGTHADGVVTWDIGNLEDGDSKTVVVTLKGKCIGSWENTVEAESAECVKAGPVVWTTAVGPPELSIEKIGPPIIGLLDVVVYDITVTNTSECQATTVEITDSFDPLAFRFVAASDGGNYANGKVTWLVGLLAAGDSKTVSVTLQAIKDSPPGSPWINTAEVQCAERELLGLPSITDEFETTVVAPELQVVCEFTPPSIKSGEEVTKSITVINVSRIVASLDGRNIPEARGIEVTDKYPTDLLRFVDASDGGVDMGNQGIRWKGLGALGPGESKTITVIFNARRDIDWNDALSVIGIDDVFATSNEGQINPIGNAEGQCEIEIQRPPLDLLCGDGIVSPLPELPQPGWKNEIVWTETTIFPLEVSNLGRVSATGLKLVLTLPPEGVILEAFEPKLELPLEDSISDDGDYDDFNHTVTWTRDILGSGETWSEYVKLIGTKEGRYSLEATVTSTEGTEDNCSSSIIVGVPALHMDKKDDIDPVTIGDTVTYTITIENQSKTSPVRFVKLEDRVPKLDIDGNEVEMEIISINPLPIKEEEDPTAQIRWFDISGMFPDGIIPPGEEAVVELKVRPIEITGDVAIVRNLAILYVTILKDRELGKHDPPTTITR